MTLSKQSLKAAAVLFLLGCVVPAWAVPSLPHLLSDHAIFQQGRKIHIWGAADAGEKITVRFAGNKASTQADAAGHWSVELPAMPAGGPFTLKVAGKKTLTINDVLIGEVWVASGQSNMTFALANSTGAEIELPKADYPEIRLFTVPRRVTLTAQPDTLPAAWFTCAPDSAKEFSAVAYYFARELHSRLNVPVGIIESAWPGTAIEEWIGPEAGKREAQVEAAFREWNKGEGKGFTRGRRALDLEFDDFELLPASQTGAPLVLSTFDEGNARSSLGGYWSYDTRSSPEATFELAAPGRSGKGFAAHFAGAVDASDEVRLLLRFHQDLSAADLTAYSGVRFWVRGEGMFRFRAQQPTINDWDDYAAEPLPASAEWTPVTILFRNLHQEGWGVVEDFTPQSLTGFSLQGLPKSGYPPRPATGLYHGMIAPLLPYAFRGAIWYQGESNAGRAAEYRRLLPAMIQNWRTASHQPDMQFLIVQLPNHGAIPKEPAESGWAELREAEMLTAKKDPNAGLAVTIDVGEPNDVHPHRKAEVGERLALWALGTTYHQPITYSGPLYESMTADGNSIRIRFTNIGTGLVAKGGEPLKGFAIAGADRKFHWASASIEGDSVVVQSPEVSAPVAVRYAWGDSPECNLFNAEGLPASPFRTDDWPAAAGR